MVGVVRGLEGHKSIWQREKTAEGLRREIFPLFSPPPPRQGWHGSAAPGGEKGMSPFPSVSHHRRSCWSPLLRPLQSPGALVLTCNAAWPPAPGIRFPSVATWPLSQGRLTASPAPAQSYLLSRCPSPLRRCSITASASPPLLCSSQLRFSGLVMVR